MYMKPNAYFRPLVCFPLIVGKSGSSDEEFFAQFLAYLESGFPLFVEIPSHRHAVVIVGYNWKQLAVSPQVSPSHVWTQIETLLTVDDNLLPYATVQLQSKLTTSQQPSYAADLFNSFIVALPDKVYYPADAIEVTCRVVKTALESSRGPDQEPLELHRYFITTVSNLRGHARENQTVLGDRLVRLLMSMETAQFVWVVEYCSVTQWQSGHVAARAMIDAAASSTEKTPIWLLHDEGMAHVFDRSSAETQATAFNLNRTNLGPLPRMELNLRPVVVSPA